MDKLKLLVIIGVTLTLGSAIYILKNNQSTPTLQTDTPNLEQDSGGLESDYATLSIENLKKGEYPGSDIVIEQTLDVGSNYKRYIASYKSEGLKIYALLTVPNGKKPDTGWPVIIFNHGYIPPAEYKTAEKYVAYIDGFARNGYIVFKIDLRGHGNSEGQATGGYGSNAYTIDVLNAVSSAKKFADADSSKIGMWGHSMGGFITLRSMVVSRDIKAGVIWAGVVGSYSDLLNNWRRRNFTPPPGLPSGTRRWRETLTQKYGTPQQNPQFWNSISANSYLDNISGPVQLHHGTGDVSVPPEFSEKLYNGLKAKEKETELYTYPGDNHNLSNNFTTAMQRSIDFFNKYLK